MKARFCLSKNQKDQVEVKAGKVRVGKVRCWRLKANNDTLDAVAVEVEDDINSMPMEEPESNALRKKTSAQEKPYGLDKKDWNYSWVMNSNLYLKRKS